MNQRWLFGRSSYRPTQEPIDPREFWVAEITDDNPAKDFVVTHHYAKSYPAARWRFGLYRTSQLVGVAVFSHPVNDAVLTNVFPGEAAESTELGRFVLLDSVEGNGESWFLARCFRELKKKNVIGVLAFSDPVPRQDASGRLVKPGHFGICYQAHNGVFLGRGRARKLRLLTDGTVLSDRTIQKIRSGCKGEVYGRKLLNAGPVWKNRKAWLKYWIQRRTQQIDHPGNYKYAWPLDRAVKLPESLPYPKGETA